jgi:hypothetical protein
LGLFLDFFLLGLFMALVFMALVRISWP